MRLDEILELNHNNRKDRTKKTQISEVYGIIYRIHCIPENKSYIGQTFSHGICLGYLQRHGIITRCKIHYRAKDYDAHKNRPLYKALNKYSSDQFEVFEERRVRGKDLASLNQIEAEYMEKYNSIHPNGYNIQEVGKKYDRILQMLAEHHGFEVQRHEYVDKTRENRCRDVCFGKRFGLKRKSWSKDEILDKLKTIDVEQVRLVRTAGEFRIIVKEIGARDNIRVYFNGSKEECEDFAKKISDNVEIAESFRGTGYKYQNKLEKVLGFPNVTKVTGQVYGNMAADCQTYLLIFYGKKDNRVQSLARISFGGRKMNIEDSKRDAMRFLDLYMHQTTSDPNYLF